MTYKCSFCKQTFKKEKTIQTHLCEKKRRHLSKTDKDVMSGYTVYVYWNKRNSGSTKTKTFDNFAKSNLYPVFVRFGRYILENNITDWEKYTDWLTKNKVKIDDWSKDSVYGLYINDRIKKETAERALERYLIFVQKWEETTDYKWYDFWEKNSIFNTVQLIKDGKISPWILFCDPKAQYFIENLPDELLIEIDTYINLSYWKSKIQRNQKDSEWITKMLTV